MFPVEKMKDSQNEMYVLVFITCLIPLLGPADGCNPLACPRLSCSGPVKLPGQCCPYCPCKYDGIYYNVGDIVFTDDPCVTCECSKYGIDCLPFPCPRVDCPYPVLREGNCCPECGCIVDGILYDLGYQVYTRNPCEECRCEYNGKVSCKQKSCPALDCLKPVRVNGECCRKCGCRGKNGIIHDFGPIAPEDICRPCYCNANGTITCQEPECPDVTCPKWRQYQIDGECCKKCHCTYQGTQFSEGDPMPSNGVCATACRCGANSERVCDQVDCPTPDCDNPVSVHGQCCPVCGCKSDDGVIEPFGPIQTEDECKTCTCNTNGTITCKKPDCPEVKCDGKRKYTPIGECCPKCRCFFKTVLYNPGDDMPINVRDPCVERCHCGDDGYEFCDFTVCAKPDCENPVIVPGQCCLQCGCLGKKKNFIVFGPILDDPCQECECATTGNITCGRKQTCPKIKCVSGTYKPTEEEPQECCQKCRCKFGGKFYKPGEVFEGPRCQACECRAFTGRVYCEKANCSHVQLQCPNPVFKPGECCPSCPNGPSCMFGKTVIRHGRYKTIGKQVCTCLGDPWFPNAFCAPTTISKKLTKTYGDVWTKFGYPGLKRSRKKD